MSILAWVVLGGFAGWIASLLMGTDSSQGILLNIIIGIVGAIIGGMVFSSLGAAPVTGFNLYSLAVAVVGSVIAIWLVQLLRGVR
jgi:uncharacterized membrane protein YeaQ/YmgE (transglycosylase-associated protein family)